MGQKGWVGGAFQKKVHFWWSGKNVPKENTPDYCGGGATGACHASRQRSKQSCVQKVKIKHVIFSSGQVSWEEVVVVRIKEEGML